MEQSVQEILQRNFRKDRYGTENIYRIYINLNDHPGAKWVSFKDKETGEVTKGVFLPDVEQGGIKVRNGRVRWEILAIAIENSMFTHILVPQIPDEVDSHLGMCGGKKRMGYRKYIIGSMCIPGEFKSKERKQIMRLLKKWNISRRVR